MYQLIIDHPHYIQTFRKVRPLFRGQSPHKSFHEQYWDNVSEEAKDLISKMLTVDPAERPSAAELLHHPWLHHDDALLSSKKLDKAKSELRGLLAKRRLKAAADSIIAVRRMGAIASIVKPISHT